MAEKINELFKQFTSNKKPLTDEEVEKFQKELTETFQKLSSIDSEAANAAIQGTIDTLEEKVALVYNDFLNKYFSDICEECLNYDCTKTSIPCCRIAWEKNQDKFQKLNDKYIGCRFLVKKVITDNTLTLLHKNIIRMLVRQLLTNIINNKNLYKNNIHFIPQEAYNNLIEKLFKLKVPKDTDVISQIIDIIFENKDAIQPEDFCYYLIRNIVSDKFDVQQKHLLIKFVDAVLCSCIIGLYDS